MTSISLTISKSACRPVQLRAITSRAAYYVNRVFAGNHPHYVHRFIKELLESEGLEPQYAPPQSLIDSACFDADYATPTLILKNGSWKIGINA